jgi:hypothetical protein
MHIIKLLQLGLLIKVTGTKALCRIDPRPGWGLFATDICIAAICACWVFSRILRQSLTQTIGDNYILPESSQEAVKSLNYNCLDLVSAHAMC